MIRAGVVIVIVMVIVAAAQAGCQKDGSGGATDRSATPEAALLAATDEARAEVPVIAYVPARTENEYLELGGPKLGAARTFVRPMEPQYIEARIAQLPADFERALGRKVTPEQARQWGAAMIDDMNRRRLLARGLLDMNLNGKLGDNELSERGARLVEGIPLAFRRIVGITKEEHDKL